MLHLGEEPLHQGIGRSMHSRNDDMMQSPLVALAPNQQRAIATPKSRTRIQERIAVGDGRQQGATDLADVTMPC